MRIPYPERIPYSWATAFAAVLLLVQLYQHTGSVFALCCFCYIMLATAAFNISGGLYQATGAFIFFNAVLSLVVGVVAKAVLQEPADSNLLSPNRTIEVYLAGMTGIAIAALVASYFRPRQTLVVRWIPAPSLRSVYLGSLIIGVTSNLFWLTDPKIAPGSVLSALRNADQLIPFSIVLGVIYTVRSTDGKRSVTPMLVLVMVVSTLEGLVFFSKQGLLTPVFCWALGAGISRYRLKPTNFIVLGVAGVLIVYYGVTIVQAGKSAENRGDSILVDGQILIGLAKNFHDTRSNYEQGLDQDYGDVNYYNKSEGLLDRLQMLSVDDLLITEADRDGFLGYEPLKEGWENLVPHLIWEGKPVPYFGNTYGHLVGLLPDDDPTTSVSFSPTADAYKEGGFNGVLIMEPLCLLLVFLAIGYAAGDVRDHPAVLIVVLAAAHLAPEGMIPGAIFLIFTLYGMIGFAVFCRYIAPVVTHALVPRPAPRFGELSSALD